MEEHGVINRGGEVGLECGASGDSTVVVLDSNLAAIWDK